MKTAIAAFLLLSFLVLMAPQASADQTAAINVTFTGPTPASGSSYSNMAHNWTMLNLSISPRANASVISFNNLNFTFDDDGVLWQPGSNPTGGFSGGYSGILTMPIPGRTIIIGCQASTGEADDQVRCAIYKRVASDTYTKVWLGPTFWGDTDNVNITVNMNNTYIVPDDGNIYYIGGEFVDANSKVQLATGSTGCFTGCQRYINSFPGMGIEVGGWTAGDGTLAISPLVAGTFTNLNLTNVTAIGRQGSDYVWVNVTNNTAGTYSYYGWVNDSSSNYNQTSTRTVIYGSGGGTGIVSELTVTINNEYNGSAINNFTAILNNATHTLTNSTTSGTIMFGLLANLTSYTLNLSSNESGGFLNRTYNVSINGSTSITGLLHQAELYIVAYEKISNASITTFNASVPLQLNTSQGGIIKLLVNSGTYQVQGAAATYTNATLSNVSISSLQRRNLTMLFFTSTLNVSAFNAITNTIINTFTITLANTSYQFSENASTTTGIAVANVSAATLTATITATGYSANTTSITIPTGNNLTFRLYPANSIYLNIYDEETNTLITQTNLSVALTSLAMQSNATTGNGTLFLGSLTAAVYTLDISNPAGLYFTRQYIVDVPDGYGSTLNAYLINTSVGSYITFFVRSNLDQLLSNVSITATKQVNSSFVTVEQRTTDVAGSARFALNPLTLYKLILSAPGYLARTVTVTPVAATYTINLQGIGSGLEGSPYGVFTYSTGPGTIVNSSLTNFTLTTSSSTGSLTSFAITAHYNGSTYTTNVTGSPAGGIASVTLNLSNITGGEAATFVYTVQAAGLPTFTANQTYYIGQLAAAAAIGTVAGASINFAAQLSPAMRGVIASIAAASMALIVSPFLGGVGGAAVGFIVLIGAAILGFVSFFLITFIGILAVMLMLLAGRRGEA